MAESKQFDVVGLGQCSFDILGRLSEFPEIDQKKELDEYICQGGGPVATALVALSRLGVSVTFCGRIGDDDFGRQIHAGLLEENVDCCLLQVEIDALSQAAFIAVGDHGKRTIFWHRGTTGPLVASDAWPELICQARILHLDGMHPEASITAAKIARDNKVMTVLDGGSVREGSEELLPLIDHLVVSEKFADQICPDMAIADQLSALLAYGGGVATITTGSDGSWSQARECLPFHQPAFPVNAVDTTGCGDVFHGGYIYGLLQGWSLQVIVRFAAACAALKTLQLGGRTAIPNLDKINNMLITNNDI